MCLIYAFNYIMQEFFYYGGRERADDEDDSGGKEIIKEYNKQQKKIINELRHEQARTFKYGCIGHGSYSEHSVFSTESGKYKPIAKKVKKDDFEK